jgi:hypothetical protein
MNHYFAHVLNDFTIDRVIVVSDEDCGNLSFPDSEPIGQAFLHALYANSDTWLETSITGEFRGRYARVGGNYMPDIDEFGPIPEPEPEPEPEPDPEEGP